jgi:hypothetical protein
VPKSVGLRMDKDIFVAVKAHTGKEVEFLGKDGDTSKTGKGKKD